MELSLEKVNKLQEIPGLLPAIAHRWSPRSFRSEPVSPADLKTVLEAARWAASSSNEQPWRFLVGVQGSETHARLFATLVPFNQEWAAHAAVLILGLARTLTEHSARTNHYALYDLGQAAAQLAVQASALGLATHQMGGFDRDAARAAFSLPEDIALGSIIALGHQAEPAILTNEQLHQREVTQRTRKPLEAIAFSALNVPFYFGA